jgi:hypothetical protein
VSEGGGILTAKMGRPMAEPVAYTDSHGKDGKHGRGRRLLNEPHLFAEIRVNSRTF